MSLDEATLKQVAQNGEMAYEKWPGIIKPLLERLNHIVYNVFPLPKPYPTVLPPLRSQRSSSTDNILQNPTAQIIQAPSTPRTLPPVPPFPGSTTSNTSHVPDSQPEPSSNEKGGQDSAIRIDLPAPLVQLLTSITTILQTSFADRPPHTVQRLAELILYPKKHHKNLPAWLRAVDRVVSVSSTADIFPLSDAPALINGVNGEISGGGILWGNNNNELRNGEQTSDRERDGGLGSDESLGGALLTPIPWLRDLRSSSTGSSVDSGNGLDGLGGSNHPNEDNSDLDGTGSGIQGGEDDDLLGEPIRISPSREDDMHDKDKKETSPSWSMAESDVDKPTTIHPSSHPFVPERQDGAVTQGELIRMEQEAGVVPVSQANQSIDISNAIASASGGHRSAENAPSSISMGVGIPGMEDMVGEDEDEDEKLEGLGIGGPTLNSASSSNSAPHARGPDVVGTVDMGLVGGRAQEVRISSPPIGNQDKRSSGGSDAGSDSGGESSGGRKSVNVNNAQEVLDQGQSKETRQSSSNNDVGSDDGSSDFVQVTGREADDEMQLDHDDHTNADHGVHKDGKEGDNDIVLVDADGASSELEREKLDESGRNVGPDASDTTAR